MKILIAEDDLDTRNLLRTTLSRWGYEVVVACDGTQAWKILQAPDAPKLAILDWMMPGMSGIEICQQVRKLLGKPYVYILLLTARGEKHHLLEGREAGADDYLAKPFDPEELKVTLQTGRRIVELQEELIAAREALRMQATRDALTSVLNRAAILDVVQRELARAERQKSFLGLIMVDLDHFKNINDTYGHQTGDAVLCEAAQRMQASLRSYDTIGRYGGEEFLIVAPDCDEQCIARLAERILTSIGVEAMDVPGNRIPITASLGGTVSHPSHEIDVDALIRTADVALYKAKHGGRNRVELIISEANE